MKQYTDKELTSLRILMLSVKKEGERQVNKWGVQKHSLFEWLTYTTEELGELAKAIAEMEYRSGMIDDVYNEAIQTATLCLKIAEMVNTTL